MELTFYMYTCILPNLCDLHDCVCMYYILTAGMDMLMLSEYSLMSITVLQMSGTIVDGLLFTGPAGEYLMML